MRWSFPKDRLRPFGKAFAALARKRPWASLRSQGGVGQRAEAARGNGVMWSLRGLVCLCTGACGGGVMCSGSCRLRWATAWLCG